jgi:hypothetical protein
MKEWAILAPGPSMNAKTAEAVQGWNVAAVGNVGIQTNDFPAIAPWAYCLVSSDAGWWKKHPASMQFVGRKFSANWVHGCEQVHPCTFGTASNSGVLALDLVRNLGATRVIMLGFDHHGTHFFGPYTNGCANTPNRRRQEFELQFAQWRAQNKGVEVINCTPGTKLKAFPRGDLKDFLHAEREADRAGNDPREYAAGIG